MNYILSFIYISLWEFGAASLYFFLTMTALIALRGKKQQWLNYALMASFALYWVLTIAAPNSLEYKLLVSLLLISTIVLGIAIRKRRAQSIID